LDLCNLMSPLTTKGSVSSLWLFIIDLLIVVQWSILKASKQVSNAKVKNVGRKH
jgi:hypothetical protein